MFLSFPLELFLSRSFNFLHGTMKGYPGVSEKDGEDEVHQKEKGGRYKSNFTSFCLALLIF